MTPQNQQLIVLYPNGPLTQYPLISLRQDGGGSGGSTGSGGGTGGSGGDFWLNVTNFFQNVFGQAGGSGKIILISYNVQFNIRIIIHLPRSIRRSTGLTPG